MPTMTIAGDEYEIDARYAEGHVLNANEANALNQMRAENIRNNMASKIKKAKDEDTFVHEAFITEVEAYAQSYEFGVRAAGVPSDPVEAKMRSIAGKAVRDALRAAGYKLKDLEEGQVDDLIDEYLGEYGDDVRTQAKADLDAAKAASNRIVDRMKALKAA